MYYSKLFYFVKKETNLWEKKVQERKDKLCDQGKEKKVILIMILSKLLQPNFSSTWLKIGEKKIVLCKHHFQNRREEREKKRIWIVIILVPNIGKRRGKKKGEKIYLIKFYFTASSYFGT